MPNSLTSLRLVDTATMCLATASGPGQFGRRGGGGGVRRGLGRVGGNPGAPAAAGRPAGRPPRQHAALRRAGRGPVSLPPRHPPHPHHTHPPALTELRRQPRAAGAGVEHRLRGGEGLGDDHNQGLLGVEALFGVGGDGRERGGSLGDGHPPAHKHARACAHDARSMQTTQAAHQNMQSTPIRNTATTGLG